MRESHGKGVHILEPETLSLESQCILSDTAPTIPLYRIDWNVTSITQKASSVVFERVEDDSPLENEGTTSGKQRNEHIFYLAHPAGAQYQTDTPAYYITSVCPGMLGNISLEASKSPLHKTEFKVFLSERKSWSDNPLFDKGPRLLFDVKPKWMGGHYTWSDAKGNRIAYEDRKGDQYKLVITASMEKVVRDALAASWCLKLWYDTAESRQAKREAMERMTPPDGFQGYGDMKMAKRIGALGSLGALG
ncbi:hypothetical protein F5Y04DRAFT_272916 [Hypomontagnella monticulosa]|nr:hypothetical protein F5Y04DRAFT_272916 [Hypomontagnella monticulosa]